MEEGAYTTGSTLIMDQFWKTINFDTIQQENFKDKLSQYYISTNLINL